MAAYKLADALLRRKELAEKVKQLQPIKLGDILKTKVTRKSVGESYDDITVVNPEVTMSSLTKEYDFYASQLRKIDAAIQQLNWTVDITVADVWESYKVVDAPK